MSAPFAKNTDQPGERRRTEWLARQGIVHSHRLDAARPEGKVICWFTRLFRLDITHIESLCNLKRCSAPAVHLYRPADEVARRTGRRSAPVAVFDM